MQTKNNQQDIKDFYQYFEHEHPTEIRVFDKIKYPEGKSVFVNSEAEFLRVANNFQDEGVDVYIGGRDRINKGDKNVISSDFIFIEIDEHDIQKPEQKEKIEKFLAENNIEIGMDGFSGGGYHYYIPHKKIILDTEEHQEFYKRILNAFKQALKDFNIDEKVFNLERVSRILGSFNFKRNQLSKILTYNKIINKEKNHEAIKKLISKYINEDDKIRINESALELLEKYKLNETDKWLYDILKKGIIIKEDTGGNSVVFKNAAIILTRENLLTEEIKIIGSELSKLCEHRTLSAFMGWIKKCYANEISEVNSIEINKLIQDNNYNLTPYISQKLNEEPLESSIEKKENPYNKLHYATEHLPKYHEFNTLVGLYGRHYIPIIKCRWYQLHGGILQKSIIFGNLKTDTRIMACYPLVTEAGKNDLIYAIQNLIETGIQKDSKEKFTFVEPISFHEEALIGKMVERMQDNPLGKPKKILVKIENRGHLSNDFIEFDECNQLINSNAPDMQKAREYLSKAENPIGRNKVTKRSVEDLPNETISYFPNSTHSYYFQPFTKLPENVMLQGFLRRKIIPAGNIIRFLNAANEKLYSDKLDSKDFSEENYKENICNHLENMRNFLSNKDFLFTEKARELIIKYSLNITEQAELHSEKIYNFMKISKWTILSDLVKMSCIIAGSYYKNEVNENFVALAYMDLVELMQATFDFIAERVIGDFSYGTKWEGADYNQIECLKYLYDNGAFSFESSKITIIGFLEMIMQVYKTKERQARNRFYDMKNSKLINSQQYEQNSSRVWLNFNPIIQKNHLEGGKGGKGYTAYNSIFLGIKDIISRLPPLPSLPPLTNKFQEAEEYKDG